MHPKCAHEVVEVAIQVDSTEYTIRPWPPRPPSALAIGTEIHLAQRLAAEHPDRTVVSLDPLVCPCSTMFGIEAAHLVSVLGEPWSRHCGEPDQGRWAKVALDRMLETS